MSAIEFLKEQYFKSSLENQKRTHNGGWRKKYPHFQQDFFLFIKRNFVQRKLVANPDTQERIQTDIESKVLGQELQRHI